MYDPRTNLSSVDKVSRERAHLWEVCGTNDSIGSVLSIGALFLYEACFFSA